MEVESCPNTALVLLTYLLQHQDSGFSNTELQEELDSLGRSLKLTNNNNYDLESEIHDSDGELQTDGNLASTDFKDLQQLQQVDRACPGPAGDAAVRALAAEIRDIADQFEQRVVAKAAENLTKKLQKSSLKQWKNHLSMEVEWVLKQSPGMDLPQEKAVMVLTMALVKGVCERAPRLLQGLFNTALQYINSAMAR